MSKHSKHKLGRGYFGVVMYRPKTETNVGSLLRSAALLDCSIFYTIGARYRHQSSDTCRSLRRVPMLHFDTWEEFKKHRPFDCQLVAVEMGDDSTDIRCFAHPSRALYVLGAEDDGLPPSVVQDCNHHVSLLGGSYNLAVAGSIIIYHREGMQRARDIALATAGQAVARAVQ